MQVSKDWVGYQDLLDKEDGISSWLTFRLFTKGDYLQWLCEITDFTGAGCISWKGTDDKQQESICQGFGVWPV